MLRFVLRLIRSLRIDYAVAACVLLLLMLILVPTIYQAREQARREFRRRQLQSIGLALHSYHEVFRTLPPGGTFDSEGVAHHSWTTFIDPYLAQSPFNTFVDYDFPWDDAINVDNFLQGRMFVHAWQLDDVQTRKSPDGFFVSHFSANERLLYRNSSVGINDLERGAISTVLAGEVPGNFDPLGYPYNWRDLNAKLGTATGFGSANRNETSFLMADGSVRNINHKVDALIASQLAGSESTRPDPELVSRPVEPYRLKSQSRWRHAYARRGDKTLMRFKLSPDGSELYVDFRHNGSPRDAAVSQWLSVFNSLTHGASVKHVTLEGKMLGDELIPFLEIPTLKRLTITDASIAGDKDSVLATVRSTIEID